MRNTSILFIMMAMVFSPSLVSGQSSEGSLFFVPQQATGQVGETITVDIKADSAGDQVNAVTADLTFDENIYELVSISDSGTQFGAKFFECWTGGTESCPPGQTIRPGEVAITRAVVPYGQSVSGSNLQVASLIFRVIGSGSAQLGFSSDAKLAYVGAVKGTRLQSVSTVDKSPNPRALEVSCHFNRDLEVGTAGEDVRCLQKFLNGQGHMIASTGPGSPGNESDYFGEKTRMAVAAWQAAQGLSAPGRFGPMSRSRMTEMMGGQTTPAPSPAPQALANSCHFNRDLEVGTAGEDVRCLQKFLNGQGHMIASTGPGSPGNESDYFGEKTRMAVAKWQMSLGFGSSGRFGPMSRSRMTEMMGGGMMGQ